MKTPPAWQSVPDASNVRTFQYSFGHGTARSFAVLGPLGWVVVSPPEKVEDAQLETLEALGPIAAIVAPNAFHLMGLAPWHARFPDAKIFAPAQSIPRLHKKTGLKDIAPVAEAKTFCGAALEIVDMPFYKTGEALVRVPTDKGSIWHVTDVIFNFAKVPPNPIAKFIFTILSDSAPGFKLSGPAAFIMMRDKKSVYRFLKQEAEKDPPIRIVPSHGADVLMTPPAKELILLLTKQGRV
jgi:hypothetical protein